MAWVVAYVLLAVACGEPPIVPDGGGGCASGRDCDDGVFCNGAETCAPSGACAAASETRCMASQTCSEEMDACLSDCDASPDADGDGHDAIACGGADCDDADRNRYPGSVEVCDPDHHDEDCDPVTFGVRDSDMDGYADARCCNADGALMRCGTDCDDATASVHPGEAESCDLFDNDCDGFVDEGLTSVAFHPDCDGDLYGAMGSEPIRGCRMPEEPPSCSPDRPGATWAANANDCDDGAPGRNPGVPEVCNGVDDDCNGLLDGLDEDDDRDGYADVACGGTDCDDADASVHPTAADSCADGVDMDCSGYDAATGTWTRNDEDADGDGYVRAGNTCSLDGLMPGDCDDGRNFIYPGATERCNRFDDDCDGNVDEGADAWCASRAGVSSGTCDSGACSLVCAANRGNCDTFHFNGCEVNISTSATHCGACGNACRTDVACEGGMCEDLVTITPGSSHTCALTAAGTVYCWGANGVGQVGNGTSGSNVLRPVRATGLTDAIAIGVGGSHTCALRAGGTVVCWGSNGQGQQGNGVRGGASVLTPTAVAGLTGVTRLALGSNHTCVVNSSRRVLCWGDNEYGQIGNGMSGPTADVTRPTDVGISVASLTLSPLATGSNHTCAYASGSLLCWGRNDRGQLGRGDFVDQSSPTASIYPGGIRMISAGAENTCVVVTSGGADGSGLYCVGDNANGELARDPATTPRAFIWQSVGAFTIPSTIGGIGVGRDHVCLLETSGALWCWGANGFGQLGVGDMMTPRIAPTRVTTTGGPLDAAVLSVWGGAQHTSCVLGADGRAYCWGQNWFGQVGNGAGAIGMAVLSPARVLDL